MWPFQIRQLFLTMQVFWGASIDLHCPSSDFMNRLYLVISVNLTHQYWLIGLLHISRQTVINIKKVTDGYYCKFCSTFPQLWIILIKNLNLINCHARVQAATEVKLICNTVWSPLKVQTNQFKHASFRICVINSIYSIMPIFLPATAI